MSQAETKQLLILAGIHEADAMEFVFLHEKTKNK